jgi:hypothetical protein
MAMARYGQRGGDGPTAGLKKAIYEATAPDGSILRSGTFSADAPKAWMHISCANKACWYANGVRAQPEEWGPPDNTKALWVECKRVK